MYFRDCKILSIFERKIPLTFRVQISPKVKTMHNAWIFSKKTLKPLLYPLILESTDLQQVVEINST
jgi:hypothetical protein